MKKKTKPTDRKRTLAVCGLSALCIAVLAGAWFLTQEPETEFIPAPAEQASQTDKWEESTGVDAATLPPASAESTWQEGTAADNTQTVLAEDGTGSVTSLSDSTTKDDASQEKPADPPVTTDDTTDPDRQPEYDPPAWQAQEPAPQQDIPEANPGTGTPSGNTVPDDSHQNQVYDPVFGWVTPSSVQQDSIDSSGDINRQIGTMGGN